MKTCESCKHIGVDNEQHICMLQPPNAFARIVVMPKHDRCANHSYTWRALLSKTVAFFKGLV